jgi:hypothetical protein
VQPRHEKFFSSSARPERRGARRRSPFPSPAAARRTITDIVPFSRAQVGMIERTDIPMTERVYDAPLAPDGHPPHRRLVGRDAIRAGISVYHQQPTYQGAVTVSVQTNDLEAA